MLTCHIIVAQTLNLRHFGGDFYRNSVERYTENHSFILWGGSNNDKIGNYSAVSPINRYLNLMGFEAVYNGLVIFKNSYKTTKPVNY